jgi:hypothetical protein
MQDRLECMSNGQLRLKMELNAAFCITGNMMESAANTPAESSATMSNSLSRSCPRCRQSLPDGVNFCVACGFYNPDPMLDKTASASLEIGKRKDRLTLWQRLANALPIFRIFR